MHRKTKNHKNYIAVYANAPCVTSCPVMFAGTLGGKSTTFTASPCKDDELNGKAMRARCGKCITFDNKVKGKTIENVLTKEGKYERWIKVVPEWVLPVAGEPKIRMRTASGQDSLEHFKLDRWIWANQNEQSQTLSDRCLALRNARIMSEDVGTWHRTGEQTVYDTNRCRNVARHMLPRQRSKSCLKHKVETNNALDNCFGWPVLWVKDEAWFFSSVLN